MRDLEHARAFSSAFLDVPTLNAKISDKALQLIKQARAAGASSSLLVLGPAGAGKTHLFERMRRAIGPAATFIYLRPETGAEASLRHVLLTVLDSLKQPVAERSYSQLDVIVGAALATAEGDNPKFPATFLEHIRELPEAQRDDLLERAIERFEKRDPQLDADWLSQLLRVPFADRAVRRAAMTWLSGRELGEGDLEKLGRRESLSTSRIKSALRSLAIVAAQAAPLVIVFDQLENLVDDEGRVERIRAHARVLAEMFDELRGLVLVQMALDGEWTQRISPQLGASERSRLEANVAHLELPTLAQREELLRSWCKQLPEGAVTRPFPAPFSTETWAQVSTMPGVTPRMLFSAARKAIETEAAAEAERVAASPAELDRALERSWGVVFGEVRDELTLCRAEERGVDEDRLSGAVMALARMVPGVSVVPPNERQPKDSKETLRLRGKLGETAVYIAQSTNSRAVLSRLKDAARAATTLPVVVVRERALEFPDTWRVTSDALDDLCRSPRVRMIWVGSDEVNKALAVHDLLTATRSGDVAGPGGEPLSETPVREWIERALQPKQLALSLA